MNKDTTHQWSRSPTFTPSIATVLIVRQSSWSETCSGQKLAKTWTQTDDQAAKPCLSWASIVGLIAVNEKQVAQQVAGTFPNRKWTK